jgi:uncharacterized protein involved in cysteine biosynthesis
MLQLFGWNEWVASQPEGLQASAAEFQKQFNNIGVSAAAIVLVILIVISVALYYFWWSNGSSRIFKYRHRIHWWLIWLFSSSIIVSAATPLSIKLVVRDYAPNYNNALMAVSICNFLYAIILFIVLSIFISKVAAKSTNASCTPF